MGENDHSHSDPKAEDARHPDSNEEPVFMADEEPEGNARQKADECSDEKWVVDFMKHNVGRVGESFAWLESEGQMGNATSGPADAFD